MRIDPSVFQGLCRSRALLRDSAGGARTIDEIARSVAMSPRHYARQFEAVFGLPPHQYRMRERLEVAKRLLAGGQHTVTSACMAVGFSSVGSFSDLFRRRVGVPPSAYRRRARALVQVPGSLPRALFPGCLSLMAALPPRAFGRIGEA